MGTKTDHAGLFRKGADPKRNKGGRPKAFGDYIREATKDGKNITDVVLSLLTGSLVIQEAKLDKFGNTVMVDVAPSHAVRLDAATFLADRGWGKPAQAVVIQDEYSTMSDRALVELAAKLLAGESEEPEPTPLQ